MSENVFKQTYLRRNSIYILKLIVRGFRQVVCSILEFRVIPQKPNLPQIDDHNLITSALKLSNQIKSGYISCEEVLESYISRIKSINGTINAVVDFRFEEALKEAKYIDDKVREALDEDGDRSILKKPLLGVPMTVKEVIAVKNQSYTGGIVGRKMVKAPKDAVIIENLKDAGMITIAMTNVPEMAIWFDSDNEIYGRTLNPYDLSRSAGGSSGGEGAVIAAGGSIVGIGSDFAGSIRIPAHFCGIFGHKATPFMVSNEGLYPSIRGERQKLFSAGPLTRYACDLKPVFKAMLGSRASRLQLDIPVDISKVNFFYSEGIEDPLASDTDSEILDGLHKVIDYLEIKYSKKPLKVVFEETKYGIYLWSAEANTHESPKMSLYSRDGKEDIHIVKETFKAVFRESIHPDHGILATYVERNTPPFGTPKHSYLSRKAAEFRKNFNKLIGENGVLLMPTFPDTAPLPHTTALKAFDLTYTALTSVLQAPITQCPIGMTKKGLPFGIQIISRPLNDRVTIAMAEELEKVFGGWKAPCNVTVD